jgi:AraC-like DNA-binding protein
MDGELKALRLVADSSQGKHDVEAFLEIWGREILRMEMTPLEGHPLSVDLMLRSLPDFSMASGSCSAMRNSHTSALVDNDDYVLVVIQRGTAEVTQYGRSATIGTGQAVLTACGAPGTFTGLTTTNVVNFKFSKRLLSGRLADIDALVARPIAAKDNILRLLLGYSAVLNDQAELTSARLRQSVAVHMHDLAALMLGEPDGNERYAPGLRAARLRTIKDSILHKIGSHGLSIAEIAQRVELSESYIRQLLAEDGTTFTDFVLGERLEKARRMLTDPRYANLFISTIAFEAGFGDLSYFNRTFRRRFGATPSDVREAHLRETP